MKRIIFVFLALLLVVPLFAQEDDGTNEGLGKGYRFSFEMGISEVFVNSCGIHLVPAMEFHIINGYQINPYFFAGIGVGRQIYLTKSFVDASNVDPVAEGNLRSFPVFIDFKTGFLNRRIAPYLSCKIGYLFPYPNWEWEFFTWYNGIETRTSSPVMFLNPGLGVEYSVSDNFRLNLFFGINFNDLVLGLIDCQ